MTREKFLQLCEERDRENTEALISHQNYPGYRIFLRPLLDPADYGLTLDDSGELVEV